ncbi:hypothetical protein HOE67_03160 [Candidatus Peregrinibacteria bacterium]|jgi:hypothetical protein|nr:hypothetical protein [Candidatus Peregrinibacteria bacterium]MBT4056085.1 hypothetical protein [Candidatus Peregrinibacteria bacterium]
MDSETQHTEAPEQEPQGSKVWEIIKDFGNRALKCINKPFEIFVRKNIKTLTELGPNPKESGIIEESITDKYIPATRNAVLCTLLGTPGVLIMSDPSKIFFLLTIIASVTGIAWFQMSLKEVKSKFSIFGVELTKDMLEAFVTTVLITTLTAGHSLFSEETSTIMRWAQEANLDVSQILESTYFKVGSKIATAIVGLRIVINKLIVPVIKFDANDAMLTGSADSAKKFYEESISALREASKVLKGKHSLEAANLQISTALNNYYEYLLQMKAPIPEHLNENALQELTDNPTIAQKDFDEKVMPILKNCLEQYKPFVEDNPAIQHKYLRAIRLIENLEKSYQEEQPPNQNLADETIAETFNNLSTLQELFQDSLITLNKNTTWQN